jgi:hypothetical protein
MIEDGNAIIRLIRVLLYSKWPEKQSVVLGCCCNQMKLGVVESLGAGVLKTKSE